MHPFKDWNVVDPDIRSGRWVAKDALGPWNAEGGKGSTKERRPGQPHKLEVHLGNVFVPTKPRAIRGWVFVCSGDCLGMSIKCENKKGMC